MQYRKIVLLAVVAVVCFYSTDGYPSENTQLSVVTEKKGASEKILGVGAVVLGAGLFAGAMMNEPGGGPNPLAEVSCVMASEVANGLGYLTQTIREFDFEGLAKTLGLPDIKNGVPEDLDVLSILVKLFQSQTGTENELDFDTAITFLHKFLSLIPALQDYVDVLQTIFFAVNVTREMKAKNIEDVNPLVIMSVVVDKHCNSLSPQWKATLKSMAPLVYKAAVTGDTTATKEIFKQIANPQLLESALSSLGVNAKSDLVSTAVGQMTNIAGAMAK